MIRKIISNIFNLFPFRTRIKIKHSFNIPSMEWSLINLKENRFAPKNILDIGAFEGEWTKMIKMIYPDCNVLMVEPLPEKEKVLKEICYKFNGSVKYLTALLASMDDQEIYFNINETASSVLDEHFNKPIDKIKLSTKTVDSIADSTIFDLIKLDTQGFELEILKGAKHTIENSEVVLMEVSLIDIYKDVPLMKDVLNFMDEKGFQIYDICSFIRRPLDKALWQVDAIFVKKKSKLLSSKKWN